MSDPGFPGGANPKGVPTYDFANFRRKLHANEEIWAADEGGGGCAPPYPFSAQYSRGGISNLWLFDKWLHDNAEGDG